MLFRSVLNEFGVVAVLHDCDFAALPRLVAFVHAPLNVLGQRVDPINENIKQVGAVNAAKLGKKFGADAAFLVFEKAPDLAHQFAFSEGLVYWHDVSNI